jgi:predicted DNA-binding transcriptional regulator AlpA
VFGADDWWTTRSVCAFLKIGRKALWNMRRDPASDFPAPVDAVGHRHLYLATEVHAWMDAQRERARRRAQDRRQALAQFSPRLS